MKRPLWKITLSALAFFSVGVLAYETDQFTTPPAETAEIQDVGPALSRFLSKRLRESVMLLNSEKRALTQGTLELDAEIRKIRRHHPGRARPAGPRSERDAYDRLWNLERRAAEARARLAVLEPGPGYVSALYERLGPLMTWQDQLDGVFGAELTVLDFDGARPEAPLSYLPPKTGNIYSFAAFHRGVSPTYFVFSSTFRIYGVYLGGDKLGHIFNQGYEYYEAFGTAVSTGADENSALAQAVALGVGQEDGLFGRIVDGVYSNADLAANLAGFWFYRNLFEPIEIFGSRYPSILAVTPQGEVEYREDAANRPEDLLRRFFTDHLNEALNPSLYEPLQRGIIRDEILRRCPRVTAFYGLNSRQQAQASYERLRLWSGMDYGHREDGLLRLDQVCALSSETH